MSDGEQRKPPEERGVPVEGKRHLHDGREDGLEPLAPLDPEETASCDSLLRAMSHTSFAGRQLGEAADLLHEMTTDPGCYVVCTLSGAMTVAKMGLVLCRMIEHGMVDCIVSTGALMAHGLTEAVGLTHYKPPRGTGDSELFRKGYNRVYDTLEMERNLNEVERVVREVLNALPEGTVLSSELLCREVGRALSEANDGPGVLRSAFEREVPIYVPAFTDSELGLDVSCWAIERSRREGGDIWSAAPAFNPFLDLMSFAKRLQEPERLGIFTIGGGVPRNWAQQIAPFVDILDLRLDVKLRVPRYRRGVRICPEPVHWGGLSGCTYSEGVSWGKFVPEEEGGRFAEVHADATAVWPLLVRGVLERLKG
jgi:deoxyhypusine synthase